MNEFKATYMDSNRNTFSGSMVALHFDIKGI